jgi:5-methylcytosine-specific restriction endonuclease McrA
MIQPAAVLPGPFDIEPVQQPSARNLRSRGRQRPTPRFRLAVYARAGFRCQGCGWRPDDAPPGYDGRYCLSGTGPRGKTYTLDVDHVVSHHNGGRLTIDNTQALCTGCNSRKGAL